MTAMDTRITNQTINANAYHTTFPNYLGPLFILGANQTPFLTMMGGMRGYKPAPGFDYAMEQYASLEAAGQTTVTEDDSVTGTTGLHSYVRGQGINYGQIMYRNIKVTYANAATRLALSGVSYSTPQEFMQAEMDFQTEMALKQLAVDMEYSCLQGASAAKTNAATNSTTCGIAVAIEANNAAAYSTSVDAGTGTLTKAMVDATTKKMADHGAPMTSMVIFAGSAVVQELSDLYGWSPVGGSGIGLGGVRVNRLLTQFFEADVVFTPHARTDDLIFADMDKCQLRGIEVPGKGAIFVEEKAKTGAADNYQLYAQLGMDYGDTTFHGLVFNVG